MVWFHLKSAKWVWVVLGLVLYFLGVIVRAWRWKILLNPLKSISVKKLFPVVCVGYMGNNIYPARAGEFLRAFILKQKDDVSFPARWRVSSLKGYLMASPFSRWFCSIWDDWCV